MFYLIGTCFFNLSDYEHNQNVLEIYIENMYPYVSCIAYRMSQKKGTDLGVKLPFPNTIVVATL